MIVIIKLVGRIDLEGHATQRIVGTVHAHLTLQMQITAVAVHGRRRVGRRRRLTTNHHKSVIVVRRHTRRSGRNGRRRRRRTLAASGGYLRELDTQQVVVDLADVVVARGRSFRLA